MSEIVRMPLHQSAALRLLGPLPSRLDALDAELAAMESAPYLSAVERDAVSALRAHIANLQSGVGRLAAVNEHLEHATAEAALIDRDASKV